MADPDPPESARTLDAALRAARPEPDEVLTRRLRLHGVLAAVLGTEAAPPEIDRFIVERKIGEGGMGVVYRARDRASGDAVALKLLAQGNDADDARFAREARILGELRHPAIVRYVAHGRTASGQPYLAMAWLDGEDLGARLRRQGLTVAEAVVVATRLAEALAEVHAHGVVHRDLKPANVFLPDGEVARATLLDFGVARRDAVSLGRLTRTGAVVGTPSYMAPEQVLGAALDGRADLFALGCVLYECLVGRPAFVAEQVLAVLARVLYLDPPRVRDARAEAPPALDALVGHLLAKAPDDRPASAAAVAHALRGLDSATGAAAPPGEAPALSTSEQRVVTLVLAAHARAGDDQRVRALARRFGTTLERVAGETLVAALVAHGPAIDLAGNAARLALALHTLVPGAPMVVATGPGVVGATLPVGEVIDRGARLLGAHGAGVWLDDVTAALLEGRFELAVDPRGTRLIGARPSELGPRTLVGQATPCVGRAAELALLDAALADATARGRARALLITAPSGVGKSRLIHEWRRRLTAGDAPARILWCRGEPMSGGAPYVLAAQLIRHAADLPEGAPAKVQRALLTAALASRIADAELGRVTTFLAELLGLTQPDDSDELRAARASPLLMGDQLALAWEDWLHAECASHPVVLVIEDLHWGDAPSVKLLDAALRALRDQPLVVVAVGRPEISDLFPGLWAARSVQTITLGELSREASEELARAVLRDAADAPTLAWISARAGGHALYLEEVIRAVAAGQRASVPASVVAMVQARLAALTADARRVVRAASVFGDVFWRGGVRALVGLDERVVAEILDELASGELINRRRPARFAGEVEYGFRHALFREAAAAMLTDDDRALGHRLAAEWLIAAGERQPLLLAEHLAQAADPRASEWFARAAEDALHGNDYVGALDRAARGRALGATGDLLGRLRVVEAEAHVWQGATEAAEQSGLAALEQLPVAGARWYDALRHTMNARTPAPPALLTRLVAWLETPPDDPAARASFVRAAAITGKHLSFAGQHPAAWRVVERAEAAAATLPAGDVLHAWTARARGWALAFDGSQDAALRSYALAAQRFEAVGDLRSACTMTISVGWLQATELGMHVEAEQALRKGLALAERVGVTRLVWSAKQNLGVALMHQGRHAEARALLEETVRAFEDMRDGRLAGGSRFYLTLLHTRAGDLARAGEEARIAIDLARDVPTTRACALAAYARALLAGGHADDALAQARAAAAILAELGNIEQGEALIRLALAEALIATGAADEARAVTAVARARLDERAARIAELEVRRSFLEQVAEHAALRAL
ncbi:MAG: protein kinase [Myxococcales bacterium]|nr:protein kinase [Myxococcales bacterium]